MNYLIFSIYDGAAECFAQPVFATTRGVMLRSFSESANEPGSHINRYASDMTLFELGEFDDGGAVFTMLPTPKSLGTALEYQQFTGDPNGIEAPFRDDSPVLGDSEG